MYVLTHREPAFADTPVSQVLERAAEHLNRNLDGYEWVSESKEIIVLETADERNIRDAAHAYQREHNWRARVHHARRIEGGWEFALIIVGD